MRKPAPSAMISSNLQRQGERLNDMAILVRASFQMRAFEDRFITLGLPYRVIGGPRFYERQEIRDALAYFRVTVSPDNDLAFERIVNMPKRGIGETSVKRMHERARARRHLALSRRRSSAQTDELPAQDPQARSRRSSQSFARWRALLDGMPHTELAEIILDESGYTQMWQNDKGPEAPGRLENLKELIRSMGEFESMTGFLEHVALVMDADAGEAEDKVNIMTLHSAKGLEFGTVFLPGWEEGLFPHQRSLDEKGRAGLEEERRLAYVGITRAKRCAMISFAQNRRDPQSVADRRCRHASSTNCRLTMSKSPSRCRAPMAATASMRLAAAASMIWSPSPTAMPRRAGSAPQKRYAAGEAMRLGAADHRGRAGGPRDRRRQPLARATGSSTRNSAMAGSPASTATSSPSISTRPAKSGCIDSFLDPA